MLAGLAMVNGCGAVELTSVPRARPGQFVAHSPESVQSLAEAEARLRNPRLRDLEPELLISCERIKRGLLLQLGLNDTYRAKIHLNVVPARTKHQDILIASIRYRDGWTYRLDVPGDVEEPKLVRAVVQVLLQEIANRKAGARAAEIPPWLTEGLAQQLMRSAPTSLLLESRTTPVKRPNGARLSGAAVVATQPGTIIQGLIRDPLFEARRLLSSRPPLTFAELSMPSSETLNGEGLEIYGSSAQLFVSELLSSEGGRRAMAETLDTLHQYLNWQSAFLRAFRAEFDTLLAVEKWWAVRVASFVGRDYWQAWRPDVSLEKLTEALRLRAEVQVAADGASVRMEYSPQQVIQDFEFAHQAPFLREAIAQLRVLRLRVAPEFVPLVDEYAQTLETYLDSRGRAGYAPLRRNQLAPSLKLLTAEALRRLNALDATRRGLEQSLIARSELPTDQ